MEEEKQKLRRGEDESDRIILESKSTHGYMSKGNLQFGSISLNQKPQIHSSTLNDKEESGMSINSQLEDLVPRLESDHDTKTKGPLAH